jgi:hypothetical protein
MKPLHNLKVGLDPYHELGCGDERPRCSANRGGANCSVEQLLQPRPTPLPRKVTNTCGYHSRSFPSPELNDWRWLAQDFPRAAATNPLSGPFSLCVFVSGRLGFPTHRYNRGVCGSLVYTPRSEFVRISEILALIRGTSDAPMVEVRVARRVQPSSRYRGCQSLAQWPHWSERMTRKTRQRPRWAPQQLPQRGSRPQAQPPEEDPAWTVGPNRQWERREARSEVEWGKRAARFRPTEPRGLFFFFYFLFQFPFHF